jgi:hypothetical protein
MRVFRNRYRGHWRGVETDPVFSQILLMGALAALSLALVAIMLMV